MIVDERMRTYINSLDMGNTPFLEELEQYAIRERVPIIRREMQSFIKMFLAVNRPKRILEEGIKPDGKHTSEQLLHTYVVERIGKYLARYDKEENSHRKREFQESRTGSADYSA